MSGEAALFFTYIALFQAQTMSYHDSVPLVGSFRPTLSLRHAVKTGMAVPCDQEIRVTVVLRASADPPAYDTVEAYARLQGLTVVERHEAKRQIVLAGTVANMQKAFSVELHSYEDRATGRHFRGRMGSISIPAALPGYVLAVLGLDNRPVAKPYYRRHAVGEANPESSRTRPLSAPDVAKLYNFPTGVTGKGQTIALIELGGGFRQNDLNLYFKGLGIKAPEVVFVGVQGCSNAPGSDADGEVVLDIEVLGAVAPGARIVVYYCPNTDQGFLAGISAAMHDQTYKPSVISISWGGPENSYTNMSLRAYDQAFQQAAAMGITVLVAAGDAGASDGEPGKHVDFPASSPFVTSCGGTRLLAYNGHILSETVWNDGPNSAGGGGVSEFFGLPDYQRNSQVPPAPNKKVGRGCPDVAGNADPATGYPILLNGRTDIVGGTSACAPLFAGLVALLNEKRGKNLGFLNPALYKAPKSCFNDTLKGDNQGYSASAGYDVCSGLGSPNGSEWLRYFTTQPTK